MSFFVKACVVALKNFPAVNAEIDGEMILSIKIIIILVLQLEQKKVCGSSFKKCR